MRYLATPKFVQALKAAPVQMGVRTSVQRLLDQIERSDRNELQKSQGALLAGADEGVFVLRADSARLFYSIGNDQQGDYALLLDLAVASHTSYGLPGRSVLIDPTKNPTYNTAINPTYNTQLNPIYNTSINPTYNTRLNPIHNPSLNPVYNTRINPTYNTAINPTFNTSLNPRYNTTLNPKFNPSYDGPYIFDKALHRTGYVVRATEAVLLLFDEEGTFTGIGVHNEVDGFTVFDDKNKWTEYWVPDRQGGFLRFSTSAAWVGIVVSA